MVNLIFLKRAKSYKHNYSSLEIASLEGAVIFLITDRPLSRFGADLPSLLLYV